MINIVDFTLQCAAALMMATPSQEAKLLFVGDAMVHQAQLDAAKDAQGEYQFDVCFEMLEPLISEADYAVANLEVPLGGKPYTGYPCFSAPDSYADALQRAGFDLLLTANNHTLDRHDRGLRRTVDHLNEMGIDHIGTYSQPSQRDSILPMIRDINGISVGFLNYTYGTNGIEIKDGTVVDYIDRQKIKSDVERTRQQGAELVCVAVHWGEEYKLLPNKSQRDLADYLCSLDVDMIIGGHPHVIQPMEMRTLPSGRPCFLVYSLGNFISNMKTRDTRGGALAEVYISRHDDGKAYVDSAQYRLVFTEPPSQCAKNYKVMLADDAQCPSWSSQCDAFVKAATEIFDKHNIDVPQAK